VTQRIETLQDEQKERFERNRELAIDSCRRNHRLHQTQRLVEQALRELIADRSISITLDRLFHFGWVNLLVHTAILHGEESSQWRAYLRVVDILLKLFRADRQFQVLSEKNAGDLLKIVHKGFVAYPVHPEGSRRYIEELRSALVQGGAAARGLIEQRVQVDEAYLRRLFVGQLQLASPDRDLPPPAPQWLDLVEHLSLDEWLVERHQESGRMRLVNLAWRSPDSDRLLLVDGTGAKVLEVDSLGLARLFEANRYARLENRNLQVVDRAIQRVLRESYDSVQQDTSRDELTGSLNRRAFERLINELLRAESGARERHVLVMFDVDQFGLVNDLCGYEGGDKLLQSISQIVHGFLPEQAQLARTGDDEFALLLKDSSLDQGYQLAETSRQAIDDYKYSWDNRLIPVSVSVGLVAIDDRETSSGELLKAASAACAIAKRAGRNCTRIYRETDNEIIEHKRLIQSVSVIEEALEKDRMVLVGQPIMPLQEGRGGSHYEVLLRLLREDGELQSPFHFITAAERYELMRSVDRWVVDHFFDSAEQRLAEIAEIGGFSINLSGESMADEAFKEYLRQRIEASPIPREKLGFEITETVMVKDQQDAIDFIDEIRRTGCSFYLDDFGSGYASFSYLKDLPVDYVKIDGIFIRDLLDDHTSHTMVKSVTEIAHFMGKQVVAEFVEDQGTADALREIGVDYIQGYHVGRPLPLLELLEPASSLASA